VTTETEIWQEALDYIRERVSAVEYHTWFERMRPLGVREGALELGVPTSFAREWVQKHYSPLIKEALARLGAAAPRFSLKVVPGQAVQGEIFPPDEEPASPPPERPQLNPKYTFENFVVGPNNQMAHAAALAVAESPGKAYNPLFIYGGVGLGKTHLMQAVGHYVMRHRPRSKIAYISTETFTNDLINAIREDRMGAFRERYRSVDLLLVDDIQFIAGKERTQEEFFHTFNTLYENHKQIILSSDRPPREIQTLEARLRSRFEWGLITDIQPPDLETRIAILKMNAEYRGVEIPEEVLEFIAQRVTSNIRELEGALVRLIAFASLNGVPITKAVAMRALSHVFTQEQKEPTMEEIAQAVARWYGVRPEQLKAKGRAKEVVLPRQLAMYLIRERLSASLPEIGQFFGGRDHTTVLYAVQKVEKKLKEDPKLKAAAEEIMEQLG